MVHVRTASECPHGLLCLWSGICLRCTPPTAIEAHHCKSEPQGCVCKGRADRYPHVQIALFTMVRCKRSRRHARGHRGGRQHRRSAQAMSCRRAHALQRLRDVRSRRLTGRPMRPVILGHQARLIFAHPYPEQEAPALLQAAATDLAVRLRSAPEHAVKKNGDPDVKAPRQCRHRWRVLVEGEGGG